VLMGWAPFPWSHAGCPVAQISCGIASSLLEGCPRQDSNLRPSAPEADSTRLLAFAGIRRKLAHARRECLCAADIHPRRTLRVRYRSQGSARGVSNDM
jgi:hypothetical protein